MVSVAAGAVGTAAITLVANTITEVDFADDLDSVTVINPSTNSADVWYTLDNTDPAVNGAHSWYVPAGGWDDVEPPTSGGTIVKMISSGTPTIRVQRTR